MKDLEDKNNMKEKLISVSGPELENSKQIFSMLIQKNIIRQNDNVYNITNISKFNLSGKDYNIYKIMPKNKIITKKKLERKNSPRKMRKIEHEEENKRSKIGQLIEDNASISSHQNNTTFSNGFSGLGMRNKKRENIYLYSNINKIKKIIYLSIPIILLAPSIQFFLLKSSLNDTSNNNYNYLEFREIFQLYYQIFTNTIGVICVQRENDCKSVVSIYSDLYDYDKIDGHFNFTMYIRGQTQILTQKIMDKRNNLVNIHKNIGDKDYTEIFSKTVQYTRLSQTFINDDIYFNFTYVNVQFSEAILIICNSFQIITNDTSNDPIYFVNKLKEPFSLLYKYNNNKELTKYQKEIYEMILNYKVYRQQFNAINKRLSEILTEKSDIIQANLYKYIYLDSILIIYFSCLLYVYLLFFQNILVKILNYVNMTMNIKNDNFNFSVSFTQKIENLETILQIYNGDPVKAIQNLTFIYNNYQQYLTKQNKNKAIYMNKRSYKKVSTKNEYENIPKSQKIVNRRDIRNLELTTKYLISIIIVLLLLIGSFIFLIKEWKRYFLIKTNLYSLIKKNLSVEASLYKSLGFYDLMIFHNYTIDECSPIIFYQYVEGDNDRNSILRSFYKDVQNSFNGIKEKGIIKGIYSDFSDTQNFTCENFFEVNNENIQKLYKYYYAKNNEDIKDKLIKICENSRLTETHDIITALQRHYQFIKNGIISITDFSYEGLIKHINDGTLGKITVFFNCILIYVLEVTFNKPHKNGIDNLLNLLWRNMLITEVIFISLDFLLIFLSLFFFILNFKHYCSQLVVLKKIFQICEIHEQ